MENGNIKVVVRVKPLPEAQADQSIIERVTDQTIYLKESSSQTLTSSKFTFDKILRNSTQREVFDCVGSELVQTVFEGIHGTALMYGQTASGKTYTCMGPSLKDEDKKGLIPRIVERIFEQINQCAQNIEFRLKISLVEIYMQKIKDLLDIAKQNLKVRESISRGVYIQNVTEVYVGSKQEVYHFIQFANNNRSLAHTNMNEASSRSHLVFVMTIYQNNLEDLSAKSAKLTLVDLAGSEKVGKTGAEGKVLDEAKQINKSLLALGNVINALTEDKVKHVPYRDSKLTRILQQSLGGNAMTNLIINISSHAYNESQTISTLRFALRAKRIKNKPTVNRQYTVAELMVLLQKAELKIKQQQRYIKQLKRNPNTSERYSMMSVISNLSQFERMDDKEADIPDIPIIEKDWQKQLQTANEQIETFKDQNIGLQSLANILKKEVQSLTERNKQLEKQNQTLKESNDQLKEEIALGHGADNSIRTDGSRISRMRKTTKKLSLFGAPLVALKSKECLSVLQEASEIKRIQSSQTENKILSEIKLNENEFKDSQRGVNDIYDEREEELEHLLNEEREKNKHLTGIIKLEKNAQLRKVLELQQYIDDLLSKYYTVKGNQSTLKTDLKIVETKLARKEQMIQELETAVLVNRQSMQLLKRKHEQIQTELRTKKSSFIDTNTIRRPFSSIRSSARDSRIVKVLMPSNFKIADIEEENSESDQP